MTTKMAVNDIEAGSDYTVKNNGKKCFLTVRTIVHAIFFVHHNVVLLHGLFFLLNALKSDIDKVWEACAYAWAFITNWNMMFQTTFLFLALVFDVLEWRNTQDSPLGQKIKYYRDIVFSGLVVPFTLFVSSFFWVIYWIDRELVFPAAYDTVVPFWFNHCVHTNVTVLVLLETLLTARRYPADEKVETGCVIAIGLSYAIIYHSIYFITHRWLYYVHATMNWWQLCLFQCVIWASNYFYYRIQFPINRLFHKEVEEQKEPAETSDVVREEPVLQKSNGEEEHPYSEKSLYLKCRSTKDQFEKTKF